MGLRAAASIIEERLRLSSKDLMTALGSGQRNWARPDHTIFLSAIWFFDSLGFSWEKLSLKATDVGL